MEISSIIFIIIIGLASITFFLEYIKPKAEKRVFDKKFAAVGKSPISSSYFHLLLLL